MSYQLGIDLGTTYTAAAVSRSDRRHAAPEMVTLGDRAVQVPSVLYLGPDGSVLVGNAAERRAVTEPDRVVREFKRQVGDPTPIVVGDSAHLAHDLVALMVAWVVERVAEREGGPASGITVTHPASWGAHKQQLLGVALAARGLDVTFLAEPQAAALSYAAAERVEAASTIAVYDLGGGTFDAAVVRKNGTFTLLGRPEGIERLGGVDFDDAVFGHVRDAVGDAFDRLDPTDAEVLAAVARLRRDCVEAKEALSADTEVRIPVLLPELRTTVRLVRGEFEALIRPQLDDSVEALRRAVDSAGLDSADLTAVLLVGGSSRIPLVAQLVSAEFGRPVAVDADPKNAIALGAALAAATRSQGGMGPAGSAPVGPAPSGRTAVSPIAAAAAERSGTAGAGAHAPGGPGGADSGPVRYGTAAVAGATAGPPSAAPSGPLPAVPGPARSGATASGPSRPGATGRAPAMPWAPPEASSTGERARRRPVGVVFGAGGLLVAAAMVAALTLWPQPEPTPTGGSTTPVVEVPATTPSVVAPEPAGGEAEPRPDQAPVDRGEAPPPPAHHVEPTTTAPETTTDERPEPTTEPTPTGETHTGEVTTTAAEGEPDGQTTPAAGAQEGEPAQGV
ncbi:MAG TPA: Hsp70 family protein [Pseudonocardia sp.]|nr:Hsp70 family protein [Pseudonocardia sp.]